MKIFISDGMRHANLSGYGELSRQITLGLADRGHDMVLPGAARSWQAIDEVVRERLEVLPTQERPGDDVDLVLQIGSPNATRAFDKPTLMYTQNALGDLRAEWVNALRLADGVIVPGEFDRKVFARYLDRVYIARQSSDSERFRPFPQWRSEGSERFTFLFVGSYAFRKGVDLLLEAFLEEFDPDEPVELALHCAGAGRGQEFNHLIDQLQSRRPLGHVRLYGQNMSPAWMCRTYNRVDAVVTLSRGEGWCMPLTEGLLCEKPVIAPASTAMGEYLDENIAYLVPTVERLASDITASFGSGFRGTYGEPGLTYYEPDVAVARTQMRLVYEHYDAARSKAVLGRKRIIDSISWADASRDIEAACLDLLSGGTAGSTGPAAAPAPAAVAPKAPPAPAPAPAAPRSSAPGPAVPRATPPKRPGAPKAQAPTAPEAAAPKAPAPVASVPEAETTKAPETAAPKLPAIEKAANAPAANAKAKRAAAQEPKPEVVEPRKGAPVKRSGPKPNRNTTAAGRQEVADERAAEEPAKKRKPRDAARRPSA